MTCCDPAGCDKPAIKVFQTLRFKSKRPQFIRSNTPFVSDCALNNFSDFFYPEIGGRNLLRNVVTDVKKKPAGRRVMQEHKIGTSWLVSLRNQYRPNWIICLVNTSNTPARCVTILSAKQHFTSVLHVQENKILLTF